MILRRLVFGLICILLIINPLFSTRIKIVGRQLFVNDRLFTIKGVCYEPIPVGYTHTYAWDFDSRTYNMDFSLIRAMGANCIRTYDYTGFQSVLDAAYKNGIYVIMEFRMPWDNHPYQELDYSSSAQTDPLLYGEAGVKEGIKTIVQKFKDHPAILMWCIGHEVNYNINLDGSGNRIPCTNAAATNRLRNWYDFLNTVGAKIHEWEAPYWHPVTTASGVADANSFGIGSPYLVETIGNSAFKADDSTLQNLNVWGVQTYQGERFQSHFYSKYKSKSSKPLWIAETGADAWDFINGRENEDAQASYLVSQWNDIKANLSAKNTSNPCIGVTFFSWCDGWYKDDTGKHDVHNTNSGWSSPYYYDGNMQEEWWGIVEVFPSTYSREKRKAYFELQKLWTSDQDKNVLDNWLFRRQSVNVPNPLNLSTDTETELWFYVKHNSNFYVKIFDYSGKIIKEFEDQPTEHAGYTYQLKWDGKNDDGDSVRTGLYLCKIEAEHTINDSSQKETQYIKIAVIK